MIKNKAALYRQYCVETFKTLLITDENITPEKAAEVLLEELINQTPSVKHDTNSYGLKRSVAEGVIRATFPRRYDANGKYISTTAPDFPKRREVSRPEPQRVPDFDLTKTLSKADLDAYAATFEINLNQSNTKDNMLLDFETQWNER